MTANHRTLFAIALMLLVRGMALSSTHAAETVKLLDPEAEQLGWDFGNGPEFPGATGSLTVERAGDQPEALLKGDFTEGGNYVQMARPLDDLNIHTLRFDYQSLGADSLTMRIIDASGQCHQLRLNVKDTDGWQTVMFPLQKFFENKGKPGMVTSVAKYENWGGANDSKWHGPAKLLVLLAGRSGEHQTRTIKVRNVEAILTTDQADAPQGTQTMLVQGWVSLAGEETRGDWRLNLGQEFPGTKGNVEFIENLDDADLTIMRLTGDFTDGGAYVDANRGMKWMGIDAIDALRFKVRSENASRIGIRLGDATGQIHQTRNALKFKPDGKWHEVELKLDQITGGETWGGANDKKWHDPPQLLAMVLPKGAGDADKPLVVEFAQIEARSVVPAVEAASSYQEGFEKADQLGDGWSTDGKVAVADEGAFKGDRSMRLQRTLENVGVNTTATGPTFAVRPGSWKVGGAMRSDLHSPDNSFKGVLTVQVLDEAGQLVEKFNIAEITGESNWKPTARQIVVPQNGTQARFVARLDKTHGKLWVDDLSASYVTVTAPQASRVLRVLWDTAQLGHMLFPGDSADVQLTVEAGPLLPANARTITWVVTDYWGAEQIEPRTATLTYDKRGDDGRRIYQTTLEADDIDFEKGRYYEVHVSVPEPGGRTHDDFTSLVYLPKAPTHQYHWREIPFTARNWDNRVPAYHRLTHRLGIRMTGIWSGWSADNPTKINAPSMELARELNLATLMGTPVTGIERHRGNWKEYDYDALYNGAKAMVEQFNKNDMMAITTANEPPEIPDRIPDNVAAYKAVYEGAKAADPDVVVVGTSIGPNEMFFKGGFGAYQDVYDFHTYNDPAGIRDIFKRYDEMFEKYGYRKPIWSTELGLNSQGLERRVVAGDLVRKFTTFFACGGANASWFGLLYPDPQGKITGSSGDSHNVFNCKYNNYSPRLDAIAYYNMVNGIAIKDFVEERNYDQTYAALFRDKDGKALQVLWNNDKSVDAFVPLPDVNDVKVTYIDGSITQLDARGEGVTLRLGGDPVLLQYEQAEGGLPETLGEPAASIGAMPDGLVKGEAGQVVIQLGRGISADQVELHAPPFWSVARVDGSKQGLAVFNVAPPKQTGARAGMLEAIVKDGETTTGLLTFRQDVRGAMVARLLPRPGADGKAAIRIQVTNHSADAQQLNWQLELGDTYVMKDGALKFENAVEPEAYFTEAAEGTIAVLGNAAAHVDVPLANINPLATYTVKGSVADAQGRTIRLERMMGGFAGAPRAESPIKIDGKLDDEAWQNAPVIAIDVKDQYFSYRDNVWDGKQDVSAQVRIVWDDKALYMAYDIEDDVLHQHATGSEMWQQDGIQLLINPGRGTGEQSGKYDYSMGVGADGSQIFCHLSASPAVPNGEVPDAKLAQQVEEGTGNRTVEVRIPWSRLVPFQPSVGANLGMSIVINEDDKPTRDSYMNWFGDILSKSVKANGDIILTE